MPEGTCVGATRCHEMAGIVTNVLLTLLRERAASGSVTLADIDMIAGLVQRGTIALDEAYRLHEERCRNEMHRPKGNVGARSDAFQRLMVRPFEAMLIGDSPSLPRPYLSHYFEFLEHALGDRLPKFQTHCRSIIQALLVVHGNNLTWEHFYADPRTAKTLYAALKVITGYLATAEGQRVWYGCLSRPAGEFPNLAVAEVDTILQILLETHRGLAATG